MNCKFIVASVAFCFIVLGCSGDSSQSKDVASPAVVEEIQKLDSLNIEVEESTLEIEKNIQSVESALRALDL